MRTDSTISKRLNDLYGRVLGRLRGLNSALGRFFRAGRAAEAVAQVENLEPRLLLANAGLTGQYFNSTDLSGDPALTRLDSVVEFDWQGDSPAEEVKEEGFSVRWLGRIVPQYSETYTFHTQSAGGVRLIVDNHVVISDWTAHDSTEDSGGIALVAGRLYKIQLEYCDVSGDSEIVLSWSSPSTSKDVVPAEQLVAIQAPSDLWAQAASGTQIDLYWRDRSHNGTCFTIERDTDPDFGSDDLTTIQVSAGNVKFSDTTVSPETTYYYRIRGSNAVAESGFSNVAKVESLAADAEPVTTHYGPVRPKPEEEPAPPEEEPDPDAEELAEKEQEELLLEYSSEVWDITGDEVYLHNDIEDWAGTPPTMNVVSSATVNLWHSQTLDELNIEYDATVVLASGENAVLANAVNIANDYGTDFTGTFDISDRFVAVNYSSPGEVLANLLAAVVYAKDLYEGDPQWDRPGITSSIIAGLEDPDDRRLRAIAVEDNAKLEEEDLGYESWGGIGFYGYSQILLRYLYAGDADMNGTVDYDDYTFIDIAIAEMEEEIYIRSGWLWGDFDQDGDIDGEDMNLLDEVYDALQSEELPPLEFADPPTPYATSEPSAPTDLTGDAVSEPPLTLTWTDTASGQNGETAFVIERASDAAFTEDRYVVVVDGSGSSSGYYTYTTGPFGVYYYRLRGLNDHGYSATDDTAFVPVPVMGQPAVSGETISLSWSSSYLPEGTTFTVERSADDSEFSAGRTKDWTTEADATGFTDDWVLLPGMTYYYRVRANVGEAHSAYCQAQSVEMEGSILPTDPAANVPVVSPDGSLSLAVGDVVFSSNRWMQSGYNGDGVGSTVPWLLLAPSGPPLYTSTAYIVSGQSVMAFDYLSGDWRPRLGVTSVFANDEQANMFALTDAAGNAMYFAQEPDATGRRRFESLVEISGVETEAHYTDGRLTELEQVIGEDVINCTTYAYVESGQHAGLLASITRTRDVDTVTTNLSRSVYSYYETGDEPNGNLNDLEAVTTELYIDANWTPVGTSYFRYYLPEEEDGYAHALKCVVEADAYEQLCLIAQVQGEDVEDLHEELSQYADFAFTYDDETHVVTSMTVRQAGDSAANGGHGTLDFSNTVSGYNLGYNTWRYRSIAQQPGWTGTSETDTQTITYANCANQPILVITQSREDSVTLSADYYAYDDDGRQILHAYPSAFTGYEQDTTDYFDGNGAFDDATYLYAGLGLLAGTDYYYPPTTATTTTPGGVAGWLKGSWIQKGTSGAHVLQSSADYIARSDGSRTLYFLNSSSAYAVETATYGGTENSDVRTTSYTYEWISGTNRIRRITATQEFVPSTQNGSGQTTATSTSYDDLGRPTWFKDELGFLSYTAYDDATGAVVKTIIDVDDQAGGFENLPAGWESPDGDRAHLTTVYTPDVYGRTTSVTYPNGTTSHTLYLDADHETRTWACDSEGDPVGPVQITRRVYCLAPAVDGMNYAQGFWESMSVALGEYDDPEDVQPASGNIESYSRTITNRGGQVIAQWQHGNFDGLYYDYDEADTTDKFLCHFDGLDDSDDFVDEKGNAITPVSGAAISGDDWRFGPTSGYFDGTGSLASQSASFALDDGDFTIDLWIRPVAVTATQGLLDGRASGSSEVGLLITIGSGAIHVHGGGEQIATSGSVVADEWQHVAVVRDGGTVTVYVNGSSEGGSSGSDSTDYSDTNLLLGSNLTGDEFTGWMDEFRLRVGEAAWTEDFDTVVPASAYTNQNVHPTHDFGTGGGNYDVTTYSYSGRGWVDRTQAPDGVISRTAFDNLGRAISTWMGPDDTVTGEWSPANHGAMALVSEDFYDEETPGSGVSRFINGNITSSWSYTDGDEDYLSTVYKYDFRNQMTDYRGPDGVAVHYDYGTSNLGEVAAEQTYLDENDDFNLDEGELQAQSETEFDELGRPWHLTTCSVSDGELQAEIFNSYTWYDARGLVIKSLGSDDVFSKAQYDGLGRASVTYTGYDDSEPDPGTEGNWAAAASDTDDEIINLSETVYDEDRVDLIRQGTSTANAVVTEKYFYDENGDGTGSLALPWITGVATLAALNTLAGDPTEYNSANFIITKYGYDSAGRQNATLSPDPDGVGDLKAFKSITTFDKADRAVAVRTYSSPGQSVQPEQGDALLSQSTCEYSAGRLAAFRVYAVENGTAGVCLPTLYAYDGQGRLVKTTDPDGRFTKTVYVGNRVQGIYVGTSEGETINAASLTDDIIVSQVVPFYDDDAENPAGRVWLTVTYARNDDGTGTGALTTTNARTQFTVSWFDSIGRVVTTVDYGTAALIDEQSDDLNPDEEGTQDYSAGPPDRSASGLFIRTDIDYDGFGRAYLVTDNAGVATRTYFDAAGRRTHVVENYVENAQEPWIDPSDPGERNPDVNRVTQYMYNAAGFLSQLIAVDPDGNGGTDDNQVTRYVYAADLSASPGSPVCDGALLRHTLYPDTTDSVSIANGIVTISGSDHVTTTYNADGSVHARTDQRGVVHTYAYDTLGRLTDDAVTSLGGSGLVDDAVLRISRAYDSAGRIAALNSYNAASGGTLVNSVAFTYDKWGNVQTSSQDHDGAAAASAGVVEYESDNFARLASVTYPTAARVVEYVYGDGASPAAAFGRVVGITGPSGSPTYAAYSYLGDGTIVSVAHPVPGLTLSYGTAANGYDGLDRFGRVVEQKWTVGQTAVDHFTYGYDAAGNRETKINELHAAFSEKYTYDALSRLTDTQRYDTIAEDWESYQQWTLDQLGNWKTFDNDGAEQSRTVNKANEILTISGAGAATPTYDAAGNMTFDGDHHYTYDAWNRLVRADISANYDDAFVDHFPGGEQQPDSLGGGWRANPVTNEASIVNNQVVLTHAGWTEEVVQADSADMPVTGDYDIQMRFRRPSSSENPNEDQSSNEFYVFCRVGRADPELENEYQRGVQLRVYWDSSGGTLRLENCNNGPFGNPPYVATSAVTSMPGAGAWMTLRLSIRGNDFAGYLLDANDVTLAVVKGQTAYGNGDTYTGTAIGWGAGLSGMSEANPVVVGDDFILARPAEADYEYDARGYRTSKTITFSAPDGEITVPTSLDCTDYYYNESWQVLEERAAVALPPTTSRSDAIAAETPHVQYLWDIRYIDALVCRFRDADGNSQTGTGGLEETLYYTNDANFNVTALVNTAGHVVERCLYDPYGRLTILNAADGCDADPGVTEWTADADNLSDWSNEVGFTGHLQMVEIAAADGRTRVLSFKVNVWLQRDSTLADGLNRYVYVRDNPIGSMDPNGSQATQPAATPSNYLFDQTGGLDYGLSAAFSRAQRIAAKDAFVGAAEVYRRLREAMNNPNESRILAAIAKSYFRDSSGKAFASFREMLRSPLASLLPTPSAAGMLAGAACSAPLAWPLLLPAVYSAWFTPSVILVRPEESLWSPLHLGRAYPGILPAIALYRRFFVAEETTATLEQRTALLLHELTHVLFLTRDTSRNSQRPVYRDSDGTYFTYIRRDGRERRFPYDPIALGWKWQDFVGHADTLTAYMLEGYAVLSRLFGPKGRARPDKPAGPGTGIVVRVVEPPGMNVYSADWWKRDPRDPVSGRFYRTLTLEERVQGTTYVLGSRTIQWWSQITDDRELAGNVLLPRLPPDFSLADYPDRWEAK